MKIGAAKEGFLKEAVLIVSFEGLNHFVGPAVWLG